MQMLRDLADPRAADALFAWIEAKNPPPHWRAEAAARMAEVGDARAARFLGERMRLEPSALYKEEHFAQLQRKKDPKLSITMDALAGSGDAMLGMALRALGRGAAQGLAALELDREAQARLAAALEDQRVRVDAALALLLGGSGSMAALLGAVKGFEPAEQGALKQALRATFGAFADEDPRERRLARWALRAEAAVAVGGEAEGWLGQTLTEELASVMYDAGPHTQTRVILRVRLYHAARGAMSTDERRGRGAALARMKERGALMALGDEAGELGAIARKALAGI